ncbi:hypothetical protein HL670_02014 [Serratia plymuthica]|nr:hypothetical protein Q5A_015295 [Serratia inhibens PRI-2C]QJW55130.1 hypothetical protein HL670_02014 [Serratia plymuthica]VEA66388.1 Uncharacterised protein [Serratia plymuthica]VEI19928.1 Uncharacterised protein [Serratia plymuthica]
MTVRHKSVPVEHPGEVSIDRQGKGFAHTSAASMGYIGRPREAEIPELEVSLESLDSLLKRERQVKA